jgi:hypothetical protein
LTNDDRVNYTVNKSKSHFGLFKNTVNNAFKNVRERPEVFGMDVFLKDDTKIKRNMTRRLTGCLDSKNIGNQRTDCGNG